MRKWQYKTIFFPAVQKNSVPQKTKMEILNEADEEGWELLTIDGDTAYLRKQWVPNDG